MNRRTWVIMGYSAASFAVGALSAYHFTKKALNEFWRDQIDLEITAALILRDEGFVRGGVERVYRRTEDIPRSGEKHDEAPDSLRRKDGGVNYHKVPRASTEPGKAILKEENRRNRAENSSSGIDPTVVEEMQGAEEDPLDNPELASLEALRRENQKRARDGKPFVIEQDEAYEDLDGYTNLSATYYAGDDVLANTADEILDTEITIGRYNLGMFGYLSEPNVVCIRNDDQRLLIEVTRSEDHYTVVVQGKGRR